MEALYSFGTWVKQRRIALHLSRDDLAKRAHCSTELIRKIEVDARRPSVAVAEQLAMHLALPGQARATFVKVARAELAVDQLAEPTYALLHPSDGAASSPQPRIDQASLPSGTVTFLFTDIEGSTRLWQQHLNAMQETLARHEVLLREVITATRGVVFKTVGDAICAAFTSALDAVTAALAAQRALTAEVWTVTGPLRVRMALHTGVVQAHAGDYVGLPLNRVARLLAAAHGGQVLLSQATQELVRDALPPDTTLRDLGQHRLKDLTRPEHIFQLVAPDLRADFPSPNTLDARPNNLPAQPTTLLGREQEVRTLSNLLRRDDVRLLTLTGPGGIGKTRLAMQVAAKLLDAFADGVWFVNLAPIHDPTLLAVAVVQTFGIKEQAGRALCDSLKHWLREKQLLLLLDNFEQIVVAAPLVSELLAAAPNLKVLVTSRMPLRLSGEREFAVAPLGLPPRGNATQCTASTASGRTTETRILDSTAAAVVELSQYPTVQLFVERAQAVKADFTLTKANAPAIAEICCQLDGLPLALELAAARIKLFPPQALLARLSSRLKLLTAGARDLPARHQTIRNTIDWSYQLLDAGHQRLFSRLGVFVGGWTLEAAEAVCTAQGELGSDVEDGLVALVDQSLVRQDEGLDGEPRFMLLETIREYALERLAARGEGKALRDQHLEHYLALAEAAAPHLRVAKQVVWAQRMELEHDNFRAALAWAHERGIGEGASAGGAEVELRLAGALFWFWVVNYPSQGRPWLEGALAQSNRPIHIATRATVLFGAGALAARQSDLVAARARLEESVAIWRELGDKRGLALALAYVYGLGFVALYEGRAGAACALFAEGVAIWRELGDKWGLAFALWGLGAAVRRDDPAAARPIVEQSVTLFREVGDGSGLALALLQLGIVARLEGDYTRMGALFEESLSVCRELGAKGILCMVLASSGNAAQDQGDYERALALYQESLALAWPSEHKENIPICLVGVAGIAGAVRQAERAVRLLSAAETVLDSIGLSLAAWPEVHADYDRSMAAARSQLDAASFAAAWAQGHTMSLDQVVAYALEDEAALSGLRTAVSVQAMSTP